MDGRYHGMDYRKKPRHAAGSQPPETGGDWQARYEQQARAVVRREWESRAAAKQGGAEPPKPYTSQTRHTAEGGPLRPYTSQTRYTAGEETLRPYTSQTRHTAEGEPLKPYTSQTRYTAEEEQLRPYTSQTRYTAGEEPLRPYTSQTRYTAGEEPLRPYTSQTRYTAGEETLRPYTSQTRYTAEEETLRPYAPQAQQPADPPAPDERPRARRKKMDKRDLLEKRLSLVVLFILTFSFGLTTLLMVILPRSTVSKIEKRELAVLPQFSLESYFSGEFTAGVANFYDDTVPMRDSLKNLGNNFKAVFGLPKSEDSVEFVGTVNKVGQKKEPSQPDAPSAPISSQQESSASSVSQAEPDVQQTQALAKALAGAAGRRMDGVEPSVNKFTEQEAEGNMTENGLIVIKQDGHFRGLELFGGGSGDNYAQSLNSLYDQVGDRVSIWSMPAPLACEFYLPSNFQEYSTSQSDCFDKVHSKLNKGIHAINICPVLSKHVDEPIYCRTDHHWQPLGAYYAAKTFAEAADVPFPDINTYTPGKMEGFVGSMYAYTGSSDLLNDPEDFIYYTPGAEYTSAYYDTSYEFQWDDDNLFAEGASGSDAYSYYLGGDNYIVKTDTQVENGRRLLIVKDSYGNATVPFFTGSFEQIYVVDMRYLQRNLISFINDMEITDVLFTMSAYSLVGSQADNLENLLTQNAGETIVDKQP